MASSNATVLAALVMACLLIAVPLTELAVSCGQVVSLLSPCLSYARGSGAMPAACCSGVKGLNAAAKTTPDRQTACSCLKRAATGVSGLKPGLMSSIPYAFSPSVDCSKVK